MRYSAWPRQSTTWGSGVARIGCIVCKQIITGMRIDLRDGGSAGAQTNHVGWGIKCVVASFVKLGDINRS